jgi:hypothetical protein
MAPQAAATPAPAARANSVAGPRSKESSALFSDAEWEVLAADPRWLAFWRTARGSLALMARSLFASFEPRLDEISGASGSNGSAIQLFDATEFRRQRIAEDVREGRFVLPSRGRTPQQAGNGSNRPAAPATTTPTPAVSATTSATALPVVAAVQAPARTSASSQVKSEAPEVVRAFLLEQVTTVTGYPAELIDFEQDLEADLGIDTVKQAQIFGRVRERFDSSRTRMSRFGIFRRSRRSRVTSLARWRGATPRRGDGIESRGAVPCDRHRNDCTGTRGSG